MDRAVPPSGGVNEAREAHAARVLLVGESNPYSHDPAHALLPWPRGAAGSRLARVLELSDKDYLALFDRVNLLGPGTWSVPLARVFASKIRHPRRILLGARVCAAHGVAFTPFKQCVGTTAGLFDYVALVLPHPSGRSRVWNDRSTSDRARRAVRSFVGDAWPTKETGA